MEQQIFFKLNGLKKILNWEIKDYDDFSKNKEFIIFTIEQIEDFFKQKFNINYDLNEGNTQNNLSIKHLNDKEKKGKILEEKRIEKEEKLNNEKKK